METLPLYVKIIFLITTLLAVGITWKSTAYSKPFVLIVLCWLVLQAILAFNGFYTVTTGIPPRFALLVIPPVVMITVQFITTKGKAFVDSINLKYLTLLHIVRIPVEITLLLLYLNKLVPCIMTFEGRNFDILSGITAILIYYLGFVKKVMSRKIILAWNIICLVLLFNIVVTAVLSAPFSFQQFGFEQPNIGLLYFPFVWLPCCVVPLVLFSHLVAIRRYLLLQQQHQD